MMLIPDRPQDRAIMVFLIAFVGWLVWRLAWHIEPETMDLYRSSCEKWLETDILAGQVATPMGEWRRRGHVVFRFGMTEPGDSHGTVILCVVEPATGQMLKPSVFDAATWAR